MCVSRILFDGGAHLTVRGEPRELWEQVQAAERVVDCTTPDGFPAVVNPKYVIAIARVTSTDSTGKKLD